MRRTLRPVLAVGIALGLASAPGRARAQSDDDRATARTAGNQGAEAFDQARYADSLELFAHAEALVHAPPHQLYMARALAKLGKLVKASETYMKVVREGLPPDAPRAFVDAHASAVDEQRALAARIPMLKIVLQGPGAEGATVAMDGKALPAAFVGIARPVDPGEHTLEARSERSASDVIKLALAEGGNETVTLSVHPVANANGEGAAPGPSERPASTGGSGLRTAAWVALGVGGAGLVAGTLFVVENRNDRTSADALCPSGVCPTAKKGDVTSLDDSAKTMATLAWVGYGVGAAAIATGAAILFFGKSTDRPAAQLAAIHPWLGIGAAGVGGQF